MDENIREDIFDFFYGLMHIGLSLVMFSCVEYDTNIYFKIGILLLLIPASLFLFLRGLVFIIESSKNIISVIKKD